MPCWTRREVSVVMEKVQLDVLGDALKAMGYVLEQTVAGRLVARHRLRFGETVVWAGGQLTINSSGMVDANAIKRAYAKEAVKRASQQQRWTVEEQGPQTLLLTRR